MAKASKKTKKQPTGDYPVGYCRPPAHTRIPRGKVLNPHGRNGKAVHEPDAFEKVRRRPSRMTIEGEISMVPSDEAFWLSQMSRALAGDKAAARNVANELRARARLEPPPPTAEDLAREAAELEEKRALTAKLVGLLESAAATKKRESPRVRFGPDFKPIVERKADEDSPGPLDPPIDEPADKPARASSGPARK